MNHRTKILAVFYLAATVSAQVNVTTANYDNERTNSNTSETILNPSSVNPSSFGKLAAFPVDGQIYAQPLVVTGIAIQGNTRNVVYTVTMHNSVYAFDTDALQNTTPLWQVNFGKSVPSSVLEFSDVVPEVGILSTPVIDVPRQAMYVVSDTLENGAPVFRLHALSLVDGHEMLNGSVVISGAVPGDSDGSDDGKVHFDARQLLQRPGLALTGGVVYLTFGSHGDTVPWHGWIIGYDATNLQNQVSIFCSTPNGMGGSLWHSGRAPAIDANGNLWLATGNGDYDGVGNFSQSILKLSTPDLTVLDWFTPDNWDTLNVDDKDLGSSGVILVPGANQLVTAGKSGNIYLVNRESLGQLSPDNSASAQSFNATKNGIWNTALWNDQNGPSLYVQSPFGGAFELFRIANGQFNTTVQSQTETMPTTYAGIAISADGNKDGTGIAWQTSGNFGQQGAPGILHAFDAGDLSIELWDSEMMPDRDSLGRFAKFATPTVANGRVYVPTFSLQLVVYGLLSDGGVIPTSPQVTAVSNGASFLQGPVAPGEIIAIFGSGLGPATLAGLQLDSNGHVASSIAGTQVFFDGVSAPLLYTSATQVGAVVPFGVSGDSTNVQILYQGHVSDSMNVTVAPAAPALIASDGTGGGLAAAINQDGSFNDFDHPADRGSYVTLYATGAGQTDPPGEDGSVIGKLPLPVPILPVSVTIDGQPAEVLYAGGAPGAVDGALQLNIRVPQSASSGQVSVVLKVGDFSSPGTVSLIVR